MDGEVRRERYSFTRCHNHYVSKSQIGHIGSAHVLSMNFMDVGVPIVVSAWPVGITTVNPSE